MVAPHSTPHHRNQRQRRQWSIALATQTGLLVMGLALPTPVLSSPSLPIATCPVQDVAVNPTQTGNVVVLGRSQGRRYVVVIPTDRTALDDKTLLVTVRQCVPKAFVTSSRQGLYIYAGAYAKRNAAEGVAQALRSRGMDARVVYFR